MRQYAGDLRSGPWVLATSRVHIRSVVCGRYREVSRRQGTDRGAGGEDAPFDENKQKCRANQGSAAERASFSTGHGKQNETNACIDLDNFRSHIFLNTLSFKATRLRQLNCNLQGKLATTSRCWFRKTTPASEMLSPLAGSHALLWAAVLCLATYVGWSVLSHCRSPLRQFPGPFLASAFSCFFLFPVIANLEQLT